MTLFDFFDAAELPVPAVTPAQARQIAAAHFGVDADVDPLGSQQDANFLLHGASGRVIGVLKIANPAFSRVELEAQDAAAAFIATAEGLRTATNVGLPAVPAIAEIGADPALFARILTYLPGGTLSGDGYLRPQRVAALG